MEKSNDVGRPELLFWALNSVSSLPSDLFFFRASNLVNECVKEEHKKDRKMLPVTLPNATNASFAELWPLCPFVQTVFSFFLFNQKYSTKHISQPKTLVLPHHKRTIVKIAFITIIPRL